MYSAIADFLLCKLISCIDGSARLALQFAEAISNDRSVSAKHTGKNVSTEHTDKNVSTENTGKNVSTEHTDKNVSTEHTDKNVSTKDTDVNVSTEDTDKNNSSKSPSAQPTFSMSKNAGNALTEHLPPIASELKDDENDTKPLSIATSRDFEDMSQDMHRLFEGKETEQNWDQRRKTIIKISRITHGNAPIEHRTEYIFFIKSQLDSILKVVDSLRTNVMTAGLNLIQHIVIRLGSDFDTMLDFVADSLITRCCNTSKVKRTRAIATFQTIIIHVTCNKKLLHYLDLASKHKDPNVRTAVSGWLSALLTKNGRHSDKASGLDSIEIWIKNGLVDAKKEVREAIGATYTVYAELWPERADKLRRDLDIKTQKILDSDVAVELTKASTERMSIRDMKAAKKKELGQLGSGCAESAQSGKPSHTDLKAAKVSEMKGKKAEDVVRPSSAMSIRGPLKDGKTSKKQDIEAKDAFRPPSAQSIRPLMMKRNMIAKNQDGKAEDAVRPPSGQMDMKRATKGQNGARPVAGQMSATKFHIFSSGPIRPRHPHLDVKRATKPLQGPPHLADAEALTTSLLDENEAGSIMEKLPYELENGVTPAAEPNVSRSGDEITNTPQLEDGVTSAVEPNVSRSCDEITDTPQRDGSEPEMTTHTAEYAPDPAGGSGSERLESNQVETDGNMAIAIAEEGRYAGKHDDAHGKGIASSSHDTPKVGKPIKIHEDEIDEDETHEDETDEDETHEDEMSADQVLEQSSPVARNVLGGQSLAGNGSGGTSTGEGESGGRSSGQRSLGESSSGGRGLGSRRSRDSMGKSKAQTKVPPKKGKVRSPSPPSVLREIDQLNERLETDKKQDNSRQKYVSTEAAERNHSISPPNKDPVRAQQQLSLAIERIRARTMDDCNYRKLQGLVKAHDTLFQDEVRYEDLLLALLDTLETPNTERRQPLGRPFDNKFQILVTIRLMLLHSRKYCVPYYARALCALIIARRNFESRCHIVGGLEETADNIIAACSPMEVIDVIDPILDVLELQEHDDEGYRAISMGLQILGGLVARINGSGPMQKTQEERLTRFAQRRLRDENSETRRATIAFCVELRRLIHPEERYFQMVANNDEAMKSLLTYFITISRRK